MLPAVSPIFSSGMSEREYHSFSGLDLLASAVILVDDACNIRYLNPAAENLVATSINTLSGRPLKEAISHSHTLQTALDEAPTAGPIPARISNSSGLMVNCCR